MIRNRPKNSRLEPRSVSKTRMPRLTSHISRIGPRSRPRGRSTNSTRRPASARASRCRTRYPAKVTTSSSLAISPGWKLKDPTWIQIRAPLISVPMPGDQRQQEQQDRGQPAGVGEPLEHAVVAEHQQRQHEQRDAESHPGQLLAGERRVVGEVEPPDHGEAEPVEGGHDGQQHGVGVRRHEPHHDVGDHDERGQPAAVPDQVGRHLLVDTRSRRRRRRRCRRRGRGRAGTAPRPAGGGARTP